MGLKGKTPVTGVLITLSLLITGCGAAALSVLITSPASDSEFAEATEVVVQATASGQGVERIELWVDGELKDISQSPSPQDSFTAQLQWQAEGVGSHTLQAIALSSTGQKSGPAAITVRITAGVAETVPTISPGEALPSLPAAPVGETPSAGAEPPLFIPPEIFIPPDVFLASTPEPPLIIIPIDLDTATVLYDIVAEAPAAKWKNLDTDFFGDTVSFPLTWPGDPSDPSGFALWVENPVMEDGSSFARCLETHPKWVDNGEVFGVYSLPKIVVQEGDHLRVNFGLLDGASAGDVHATLSLGFGLYLETEGSLAGTYQVASWVKFVDEIHTFGDGLETQAKDLSPYAGSELTAVVIDVNANGPAAQDWFCWVEAKILRP